MTWANCFTFLRCLRKETLAQIIGICLLSRLAADIGLGEAVKELL